ncbi:MAG: dehydrogenase E1 component subunit alpha/beta [Bryobacterales bacterium]|nr:dehydrogenase E1 component subunit alpha/beta [Bryobacterales bacterium]MDE0294033.1 dehydrogenase E1 component subunit alpha/beta [Bryobacterales bacterium]MDE0435410.1 dehydrogenase E1 component subunit alpha/beta [Bryobacterales bacterium]
MADLRGLVNEAPALDAIRPSLLLDAYRNMYLSRRLDDREIILKRRNEIFFQVSAAGHEAVQTAAGMLLDPGFDWVYPYYRDRALCLAMGVTPLDMLLQAVGAASDSASGGRQMPSHWSNPKLNIVSTSSPTGTQFLQAVGCAHADRLIRSDRKSPKWPRHPGGNLVLVCSGEGATSEGEFWEALNAACLERLPLLFLIEDNGYAISVPVEAQTAGGSLSRLARSFPDLDVHEVDGLDFLESCRVLSEAVDHCREGHGPALVHAYTIRPYSHSLSDDESLYKPVAEREDEASKDPIRRLAAHLEHEGIADEHALLTIHQEIDLEIQEAVTVALKAEAPPSGSAMKLLYSPTVNPTADEFDNPPRLAGEPKTMVDLINTCLRGEMQRDDRIFIFGQDVADCTREEYLDEVKGKGGVFKVTHGLQRRFGSDRVFNAPIAEAAIVGRAIGMATRGLKPVVEIQFFDYIWPAMMQIRGELATLRWRSNNGFSCPLVVRVPIGGYLGGGAVYHSQSGEVLFTHIPGLRVVMPSNALDANGLLRTAIRCDDPVLFLEHKKLYRETYNRAADPGPEHMVPFGRARCVKEGSDLTLITYGAVVHKALLAAQRIEKQHDATVEILDLRSLSPYDWVMIAESVSKTSRAIVAHEDCLSFGYGAEIAARIGKELFDRLDAPVSRVGAKDTWVAYNPRVENRILPQTSDLEREIKKTLAY